ncbi:MAG: sulfite exporter TauE/SafE family protein, partial [Planctomycetes bacterium]|nr:sulfite exporter TauE/SafE family protein [Planctomycetota bacterium]
MTLLWVLALAAFATSIISGIIGMGGGILLLATMLSFLSHAETIPAHG